MPKILYELINCHALQCFRQLVIAVKILEMVFERAANLFYDSLLAIFYPQSCEVCGRSVESRMFGVVCKSCWRQTHIFTGKETLCWKCGLPSPGNVADGKREQVRCRRCDDDAFSVARACGVYEGALRASILALKRDPYVYAHLTSLLRNAQHQYPLNLVTRVIPVPLHPERQKTRGFNQAALLAGALSRTSSLVFDQVSLVRASHTDQHRAGMDARDRRRTVESAFEVRYPALVAGERVLLIDDVFTTGATVSACARALIDAGAEDVFVLTLARPINS